MKKIFPVVIFVLIAAAAGYFLFIRNGQTGSGTSTAANSGTTANAGKASEGASATNSAGKESNNVAAGATDDGDGSDTDETGDEGTVDKQDKPAAEVYKSAEEALAAIKQAALSYDDLVLEQFTQPGEDCSWCDSFYSSIKDLVVSPEVNQEQRNYFAEVLAVSGRVENVRSLVEAIKNSPSQEVAESLAEALELSVGKDDVVNFLGDQLNSDNQTIRESSVAAITNQGSRQAVDLLYKNTLDKGDPDGYYSLGIGLGELVPEEDAMPKLQEIMLKRDQYSHLAVKSLLNAGAEGLKLVFDSLSNSKNSDFDKEMLKGAIDHISWDEDTMAVVDKAISGGSATLVQDFAKQIKQELKPDDSEPKNAAKTATKPDAAGGASETAP